VELAHVGFARGRVHPNALAPGALDVLSSGVGERLAPHALGILREVYVNDLPLALDRSSVEELGPRLPGVQVAELGDDPCRGAPARQLVGERPARGGVERTGREPVYSGVAASNRSRLDPASKPRSAMGRRSSGCVIGPCGEASTNRRGSAPRRSRCTAANSTLPNTPSLAGRARPQRASSWTLSTSAALIATGSAIVSSLVQPLSGHDQPRRPREDPQIQREGSILHVPDVELDPLLPAQ
jgi:hypothetical protein